MKILIDPQIFIDQKFGGISRYYTELLEGLDNQINVNLNYPILYTDNIHFRESSLYENSFQKRKAFFIKISKIIRYFRPRKLKKRSAKMFINLVKEQDYDLVIPTYYNVDFLDDIGDKPFVLTVYDMIHEIFPQHFVNDKTTVPHKKMLIEKATKIIAISESTKADILKFYPEINPSKIEVVYLSHSISLNNLATVSLPKNYILFVGNRGLYKNFNFFLNAVTPILKSNEGLTLLCAGGNKFNEEEKELILNFGLSNQVIQQNFEDAALPTYYKNAKCFVFPSAYEGFGIPVLEAMACGCPVVLANHSSFPEVAGEAGVYFDLNNEKDLKHKIESILNNETLRKEYSLKGFTQVKKFSWEKTVKECYEIYKKVI